MKKAVRITAWILALLLLIQIGAVVVLQSPAVQTWLGKKAIGMLEEKVNAHISFSSASIRPFDALVVEDVLVMDSEPLIPYMDTLLYVKHLSARFSVIGLLKGDCIKLKRANLDGGCFHLVLEWDPYREGRSRTNLQRIFNMPPPSGKNDGFHWGDILDARNLEVRNFHYRMELPRTEARQIARGKKPVEPGVIDWNHLNLVLEHLKVNHLRIADDLIECDAREMYVHELETGLRMQGLAARTVRVGKGNMHLDDFKGRLSPGTILNVPSMDMRAPLDDYDDFENKVHLDVLLAEGSVLDMRSISHFSSGLGGMDFRGSLRGRFDGPVSNFRLMDMVIDGLDEEIHLETDGHMTGLPEVDDTRLEFQIHDLSFSMASLGEFVRDWAPGVKMDGLKKLAPGESFSLSGRVGGTLNIMDIDADVRSRIGDAWADITIRNILDHRQAIGIGGTVDSDGLNLGTLLGREDLGPLTMRSRLDAAFPKNGTKVRLDSLHVLSLNALGYEYKNIGVSGNYEGADFDFALRSDDPNLLASATGVYHETPEKDGHMEVDLKLDRANLEALNLAPRSGKSLVSLDARAALVRNDAHTTGTVNASRISLVSDSGTHPIDDIVLHIDARDGAHKMTLQSAMLDASYSGDKAVTAFAQDLKALVVGQQLPALSPDPASYSGASYSASLKVHKLQELLDFVAPGAYVENGTEAQVSVTGNGRLKASLTSGRIALRDKYVKDLRLRLDNENDALIADLSGGTLALGATRLLGNRLTLYAAQNRVGLGYTFDNEAEADTRAELYLNGGLDRDEKGLSVSGSALPSNFYYKGNGWGISSGEITYKDGRLHVDKLQARHEEQLLLVDGGYSPGKADTLSVTMDRFDLALVNSLGLGDIPPVEGQVTGRARVVSSAASSTPVLLAGVTCDSTSLGGKRIGRLQLSSIWDEPGNRFRMRLRNSLDGRTALDADATLSPSTKQVDGRVKMDRFSMGVAEPFLTGIFHAFDGDLSGEIGLGGSWDKLQVKGDNIRLDDGLLDIDFTRVPYKANGILALDGKGLHFKDIAISDGEKGSGSVAGSILFSFNDLRDIRMDTHIKMKDMRALALPRGVNPMLWGDIYAGGSVDITGPLNRITLALNATNAREGTFHLPIGSSSGGSSTNILSFTESAREVIEDPYELMMNVQQDKRRQGSDFRFTGRITATPSLQVNLDLDEESSLTAYGSGTIELESRSSQGIFTLGGDYAIHDGSFHFSAMNLVNRKFTIQDGSSIRFNGDVWDTDLDVLGRYTTKASLSNLLPSYDEESSSSSRRTVFCGIHISGKMRNPVVDFDIEVPDLNPIVQTQVESALNSEDKVQKQFVYLLLAGNFLPTEESGVTTNGSEVLYSNVSSIMSGQINNIFQKLDIPLDLGLNYQTTQAGMDLFDVAVSTQLFNNRVLVNGTVGNKQIMGGLTTNEVAGDLDVEIKLNRSGSLRLSLFSHSADQYTYYLDNSQRNGGGIAYQREFNSLVQFFRELFASPSRREQMALEAASKPAEDVVLKIDENGTSYEQ